MCWDLPTWRCVYTCVCVCLCCSEGCYYKAIIGRCIFWPLHWRAHVDTHTDKHTPVLWLNLAGCIKSYLSDLCSHLMPWDRLHTAIGSVHTHRRDNMQLGGVVRANEGWIDGGRRWLEKQRVVISLLNVALEHHSGKAGPSEAEEGQFLSL